MATFPLATLAATIDDNGITAPSYADILASLKASFQIIYGADAYLEPDGQDGQLLAVFALGIHDANQATIACYNSFSPATAQGVGLSNAVKINHMSRLPAAASTVNLTITGTVGTTITGGIAGDPNGGRWVLPSPVTIPSGGTLLVTATAEANAVISASIGTVTIILTPTAGWSTVTNPAAATVGTPIETDALLRARQEITPAINSYTVLSGLAASLKALTGVTYGTIYENDTASTDANGIVRNSIACVVKGGDSDEIARTIYEKKAPGVGTHGSTTVNIVDISGTSRAIKFTIPTEVPIKVAVTVVAQDGYTSNVTAQIKQAITDYINSLAIGADLIHTRLYAPALLLDSEVTKTYKLTILQHALHPGGVLATTDTVMAFASKATCAVAQVTVTVL